MQGSGCQTAAWHQLEADLFWPYTATAEKTVTRHQFEADLFWPYTATAEKTVTRH